MKSRTLAGRRHGAGTDSGDPDSSSADWLNPGERAIVRQATELLEEVVAGDLDAGGVARCRLLDLVTGSGSRPAESDRRCVGGGDLVADDPAERVRDGQVGAVELLVELFDALLEGDDPASSVRLAVLGEATRLAGALRSVELGRLVAGHAAVAASGAPAATLLAAAECLAWLPAGLNPDGFRGRLRCDLLIVETLSYLALDDRTAARRRLRDARACAPADRHLVLATIEAELAD